MLEFKNVTKKFNETIAVDDVSFTLKDGRVLGLIGRNGAGKSTIFRMILNLIEPTQGEIFYNNEKVNDKILDKFGFLPEEGSLLPQYSVIDVCEYYAVLKNMKREDIYIRLKEELKEFGIEEYFDRKIKTLSKGNKQKIQFIISNLHNPELLILDEPFSGLDPVSTDEFKKAILRLKSQGKTIIFSSHIMNNIEDLCDDILLINKGKSVIQGDLNEIKNKYKGDEKDISLNDIFIKLVGEKM